MKNEKRQRITKLYAIVSASIAIITLFLYTKTGIELAEAKAKINSQQRIYEETVIELNTQIDSLTNVIGKLKATDVQPL